LIFFGLQTWLFFFVTAPHFLHSYRPGFHFEEQLSKRLDLCSAGL